MRILFIAAVLVVALIPVHAVAGTDGASDMVREHSRKLVIQRRAFEACLAAAKTEARIKECHEILKQKV